MPALSKKQQKFFGIVRAIQKGEQVPTTPETAKAAADMKKGDVKKFASTKHKGLPEKKKVEEMYNEPNKDQQSKKQIDAKERRANAIKKQVLMKKIQAVRSGAGSEIMASNNLEGEVIEGYGNPKAGPALKMARLIDKTKPNPRSKRAKISQYLKKREMEGDKKKFAAMGEENNPRIPRKKGQPANSKKHSDLYTDENPKGTIHGLGFKDEATAKASVSKIRKSSRSHAHKIQAAVAMEQRAREMGKTSEAAIYRKFINSMKKKTKSMNEGSLHKWFKGSKSKDGKGGWVNVVTGGTCASDEPGEGTPKCVSSAKRASMSKSERLSAARRKKKADPGQQSKTGAAKPTYVSTDSPRKKKMKKEHFDWRSTMDEAYGGTGVSRKAKLASTHPPTAQAAVKNIPTETDRGAGNKAMRRAGKPVEKKSPNYKAYVMNKEEKENKNCGCGKDPCETYGVKENKEMPKNVKGIAKELDKAVAMHKSQAKRLRKAGVSEEIISETKDKKGKGSGTKDACYHKVKSRYSVWPSAYASGALVKCRKVGAANWGNSSKKEEFEPTGISFQQFSEKCWKGYEKKGMKTMFGKRYPNCVKKEEVEVVEAKYEAGASTYGKTSIRNKRKFGTKGENPDPLTGEKITKDATRGELKTKRREEHIAKRGVKTKGMKEAYSQNPAQQAAIAIAKKNRKQDLKVASKVKMKKESSDWRKDLDYEGKDDSKKLFEDDMKGMSVKSGHKRPTKSGAGMTKKGVEAYRRRNPGSKLQTAVTTKPSKLKKGSKAANRRKSYCARSAGQMKKFPKAAKDPNSRLRQARRRWNC